MTETLRLGELCAGYGGLGLALELTGIPTELAWYSEHDPSNSKQPAARIMAELHPGIPNLGDLRDITDPPPADIITAGFPCGPVSVAGQRAGVGDERWLIRDVVAVWRASGARWLILENVSGLLTANGGEAFGQVLDAISEVGASCEWAHLRASDVGACHRRDRWFCVVSDPADAGGLGRLTRSGLGEGRPAELRRNGSSDDGGASIAHTDGATVGPEPISERRCSDTTQPRPDRQATADADAIGLQGERGGSGQLERNADRCLSERFGGYAPAIARWEHVTGRPAPEPTDNGRLNPVFVEWMQGLPLGHVTGTDTRRAEQLGVLGNGVVPQQAAHAITQLLERTQ